MFLLGVDGGSTKTVALVSGDNGRILGYARGGGSNWSGEDVSIPMGVVADTVRAALAQAGLTGADVAVGVFTLAGADWPEDHLNRRHALEQEGIARRVIVKNDSFGGLRAGTSKPYGMVLAAGSGMNAAVITPDGQEWAFGYYETFGGSRTIAQETFHALLRAEDGRGQPTRLTAAVLERLGFPTTEALLRASVLGQVERRAFLSITPLVFEAALAGDEVAAGILVRQAEGLAEYVTSMARRFHMKDLEFDVVLAGSVFKGVGPLLVDTLIAAIHRVAPRASIIRSRYEPVIGSLLLAFDALGILVSPQIISNIEQTTPGAQFFDTAGNRRDA